MRRKERETDKAAALEVVDKCAYAVLCMSADNRPYAVPVSIARDGGSIYVHCAPEGTKTDVLRANPAVEIVCVGDVRPIEYDFSTEYESAIVFGRATEITEDGEKIRALRLICDRYAPSNPDFDDAVAKSLKRTAIWKFSIDEITGKHKKYPE